MEVFNFFINFAQIGTEFLGRGSLISGMTILGITFMFALAAILSVGVFTTICLKVIDDSPVRRNWIDMHPFNEEAGQEDDSLFNLLFNSLFYLALTVPMFSAVGVVLEGVAFFISIFADYWVPFAVVGGIIGTVLTLRTLKRLVKVVKGHVLNNKIHNEGVLDTTGLAEKMSTDDKAALLGLLERLK